MAYNKHVFKGLTVARYTEFSQDIEVEEGATVTFPNLTTLTGGILLNVGAKLVAPLLTGGCVGRVNVGPGATLVAPRLAQIKNLTVHAKASVDLEGLTTVGFELHLGTKARVTLPNLLTVGQGAYEGSALCCIELELAQGSVLTVPKLTRIYGELFVSPECSVYSPNLEHIDYMVYVDNVVPLKETTVQATTRVAPAYLANLKTMFGKPGKFICLDEYVLWKHRSEDGLEDAYSAGCQKGLSLEGALRRWDMNDRRAVEFSMAILDSLADDDAPSGAANGVNIGVNND